MSTRTAKLHELRHSKKQLHDEYIAIVDKENALPADELLPEEDAARLIAIKSELSGLGNRISNLENAIELEADNAIPLVGEIVEDLPAQRSFADIKALYLDQRGFKAARFIIGHLHAKQHGFAAAAQFIENRFGDKEVAKALNTAGTATGGALIPQAFMAEVIELLRARVVVRRLNPVIIPMPLGNMTIPRLAAGATAAYQGELDDISVSQETFDDIQLNAKKLVAIVTVTNDLIRRAPIGIEAIIRDDLTESLARREDIAFLRGDGSGNSPIGLLNLAASANKLVAAPFAATDNATILTTVIGVANGARLLLEQNMSRMLRTAWIFHPQVKWFLSGLRDGVGNFVYKDEIASGKFLGLPFETSQQLPTNLNTAVTGTAVNNGSEIYLADFADVVLGETYNMTVDASDVAAYKDGSGNIVSAFQRDQTVFRVISEHDLNLRHQASVIVITVPGWAPAGYTDVGSGQAFFVQPVSTDASAAPSTWGSTRPTGSNNPGNSATVAPGGTLPGVP